MDSATARSNTYVAYMLRLWQAGSREGMPVWRASLENPHTGERLVFGDPKALFAFLTDLTCSLTNDDLVLGRPDEDRARKTTNS